MVREGKPESFATQFAHAGLEGVEAGDEATCGSDSERSSLSRFPARDE